MTMAELTPDERWAVKAFGEFLKGSKKNRCPICLHRQRRHSKRGCGNCGEDCPMTKAKVKAFWKTRRVSH